MNLNIRINEISKIWKKITNKYNNIYLDNLIMKIESINNDIENYILDIWYPYKEKK